DAAMNWKQKGPAEPDLDRAGARRRGGRASGHGGNRTPSEQRQVDRLRTLATLVGFGLEGNLLPIFQPGKARGLHSGDMDENVLLAVIRLDEAKALGMVEEFHSSRLRHGISPWSPTLALPSRPSARSVDRSLGGEETVGIVWGSCQAASSVACRPGCPRLVGPRSRYSSLRARKCPNTPFFPYF